jgi:hypothetical protein
LLGLRLLPERNLNGRCAALLVQDDQQILAAEFAMDVPCAALRMFLLETERVLLCFVHDVSTIDWTDRID